MHKLGLKLWSVNISYIPDAEQLFEQGIYNYIELFAVPDSFNNCIHKWKELNIPYIIHAPHSLSGLNPASAEMREINRELADESKKFADHLNADIIIFHPGINGKVEETAIQFKSLFDSRMLVENKPYLGIDGVSKCNGNSPEEIKYIIDETKIGFCLDVGHAIYAANAKQVDPIDYVKDFLKLSPKMFHLSDGDFEGILDNHLHFGQGNFPLNDIIKMIPENFLISIETKKDSTNNLFDFINDIKYLKHLYEK